jgi:hypothetical protein
MLAQEQGSRRSERKLIVAVEHETIASSAVQLIAFETASVELR